MKIEIIEGEGIFNIELKPETPQEISQLVRFASGSRKKTLVPEITFYRDGTVIGYITSKKHRHKSFGTIK